MRSRLDALAVAAGGESRSASGEEEDTACPLDRRGLIEGEIEATTRIACGQAGQGAGERLGGALSSSGG